MGSRWVDSSLASKQGHSWIACSVMLLVLLLAGCSTPGKGLNVFAPYRGSQQVEEYRSPPPNDPRFAGAPTYPSQLLKPVVKVKDEETGTGLRRAPIGTAGNMPGMGMPGNPY